MIKEAIAQLIDKRHLTQKEAHEAMQDIMEGKATPSQIAGFLVALRNLGETAEEIAGCALAMRNAAQTVSSHAQHLVDCCGTGGDGKNGLNISTAAAFIVAGAGLPVAKHGNRSVSSQCGSADVLEVLGVRVDAPPAVVEQELDSVGVGFLFAPVFHPAMKHAMPTRRELGIRTVFNVLGPLTNPARTAVQLIGVYKQDLAPVIAKVLVQMKHKAGLVVHSRGWDEITLSDPTVVHEVFGGRVRRYSWTHRDFGLPRVHPKHLRAGDARKNAAIIADILDGKNIPARHVTVANAAALIWIAEKAYRKPIALKEAVLRAEASIDTGTARNKLKQLAEISHNIS